MAGSARAAGHYFFGGDFLGQKNRAIDPDDIVPAQDFRRVIEKLRVRPARTLEREVLHPVGRIRGRVPRNIQHLFLVRNLIERRVLRRVELYVRGSATISDTAFVLDVHFQVLAGCRGEHPILRIQNPGRPARC